MKKRSLWGFVRQPLPLSHIAIDTVLIVSSLYLSLLLRVGYDGLADHIEVLNRFVFIFVIIRLFTLMITGVYSGMWRYVSLYDVKTLVKAIGLSAAFMLAVLFILPDWGRLPRSLLLIDFLVATFSLLGIRVARRMVYETNSTGGVDKKNRGPRTLVYGAGANGRGFAQRVQTDPNIELDLIGFLDDDQVKRGRVIAGYKVLGGRQELESILESTQTRQLIVAISSPEGSFLRDIVGVCRKFNINPQVITEFSQKGPTHKNINLYRKIELEDLLARNSASIDLASVRNMIEGKCVLVTGAGGSIGSEIARQVSRFNPSKLLLLDHSEYNLYEIDRELRVSAIETDLVVPLLIDIKDKNSLESALKKHTPEVVFHAAAYKHVHLVESNPFSSILNNVYGTKNLLDVAAEIAVKRFVLISTDKAVNPAGTMGASKRVCELITSIKAKETGEVYCSVRFGNVLGSSGSLIPLLQKQIEEGGPVTITHKDMTRYFMLIPEAVSLVLMSAAISKPGDINVLKMGEPVKILDIARSLIALMGKSEDDIPILFTGLRPGEKIKEELYLCGDELTTQHPDILTLPEGDLRSTQREHLQKFVADQVDILITQAKNAQTEALISLNEIVRMKSNIHSLPPHQNRSRFPN